MINTSEVLEKLGEKIAASSTLANICRSTFGRGCQVAVSGYSQKLLGDSDAPFVMVFPDEDDMNLDAKEVTRFIAKVVIGFCPVKDIPSSKALLDSLQGVDVNANTAIELGESFIDQYVGDESREEALQLLEYAKEEIKACAAAYNMVQSSAKSGDLDGVIEQSVNYLESVFKDGGLYKDLSAILVLAKNVPEDDHFFGCVHWMPEYKDMSENEIELIRAKWEDFNENPFIADVRSERSDSSNGLTVFGSINIIDSFRNCLNQILDDNDFGIPVSKVTMKNNSSSHYPLEWSEVTIEFSRPETLSL